MSEVSEHAKAALQRWRDSREMTLDKAVQASIDSATAELRRELEEVKRERDGWKAQVENFGDPFIEARNLKREVEELRSVRANLAHADEKIHELQSFITTEFSRGYFCAVAKLVETMGLACTVVRGLFAAGGNPEVADECDQETFREHGLMPDATINQREK